MDRYICIHGHFYQPPRENPWLETVELQDSAYPYHDWNERITAECYAPNAVSRMLDSEQRIINIVNNYAKISFNFGPTLLSWMEQWAPDVYRSILDADQQSQERFSGHGSAMAQVYNHVIMPLANRRDKETQIIWGLRDFEHRFGRKPEGMWLAETAVDLETLDLMAEHGIKFTVLSPYQASRVRRIGEEAWRDATGGRIDPTMAYLQRLPSGRTITLFYYDGPISRAVAFERLLTHGETFANRLLGGFADSRDWPQLVHIATDGESYGHHHPHGDMALAHALHYIETTGQARLTNYGEFLALYPPTHEVEVLENTAWSCAHGVERWRSDCGCNSGRVGWNQGWRRPLREALDWLRDAVAPCFEKKASELVKDPWAARNDYISVILDRSDESIEEFCARHVRQPLEEPQRITLLKLMELQRHAQLMYTSCGWFFDEISGVETVQIIAYAGRVIQLAAELFPQLTSLEADFLARLEQAKSNIPEHRDGKHIYEKWVKPAVVDWEEIGAHYAVSSLFETYEEKAQIFCYTAEREDFQVHQAGRAKLVAGKAKLTCNITRESEIVGFGCLHFGDHNVNGGIIKRPKEEDYQALVRDLAEAFNKADFPEIIRLFDHGFGGSTYSLKSLFRDEQRAVMKRLLSPTLAEAEAAYRRLYHDNMPTMRFLADLGVPLPQAFRLAIEFVVQTDLYWAFKDDEPDLDQVKHLLDEAQFWNIALDTAGLSYRLEKTIRRLGDRLRSQPDNIALLKVLDGLVGLARSLPFEVDLWQPQNAYFVMLHSVFADYQARAIAGDEDALVWMEHFLDLGDKLGIQVAHLKKKLVEIQSAPSVEQLVRQLFTHKRIPRATYRLQFNAHFRFADAKEIVGYLNDLGISDCYASPLWQARAGSTHGYDIVNHSRLNPELGETADFDALSEKIRKLGMGLILDTVPNHMGIGDPANEWWQDVLENGPSSPYAAYFDIEWNPANPSLENKVLLPILEDQYGKVLESGKITLAFEAGRFLFRYYHHELPVAPHTYGVILEHKLPELQEELGEDDSHYQELCSIITAISYLPLPTDLAPDKIAERHREKEVIKRRIDVLCGECPRIRQAIDDTIREFNGVPGIPESFDQLDALLDSQSYRPAYWRVATEEINYRRFFDINELAAICVERSEVFAATHQLLFQLLADQKVTGIRIDHPDGLWNPTEYFRQVQHAYVRERVLAKLKTEAAPEDFDGEIAQLLQSLHEEKGGWPLYVVAEKILSLEETLPVDWAIDGTTGYDFLNMVNGLFIDSSRAKDFSRIYHEFLGKNVDFQQLVKAAKKMTMLVTMASEINALSHRLDRLAERNRRFRDFTLNSLTFAIREVIACLRVYRTYISGPENVALRDRLFIEAAVDEAKKLNPRTAAVVFDFIRDNLLLRNIDDIRAEDRPKLVDWVMKFQQVSGPIMAKGVEDTVFYVFNRLVSLNEVGGEPDHFGISVAEFHKHNQAVRRDWPHSMLTTATHDTKRGEDVRARLNVLSEMPDEWQKALHRWRQLNADKKKVIGTDVAPDANDEYLLYQTLIGAWPTSITSSEEFADFRQRIRQYMEKAIKEAKVYTSWINPNVEYDSAVQEFVHQLLTDDDADPFRRDIEAFQARVAYFGYFNSLSQTVLKLTSPGVPDIYQGAELWDLNLVDPDNRRPVDYRIRQQMLRELTELLQQPDGSRCRLLRELVDNLPSGRIKLFVTYVLLNTRRRHADLFSSGSYEPLDCEGAKREHVCAFMRRLNDEVLIVIVPRLVFTLTGGQQIPPLGDVWQDTHVLLGADCTAASLRNIFTGLEHSLSSSKFPLADACNEFPVAVLTGKIVSNGQ
ncbi:MAG: hypothetical protein KatS3mg105_2311 [Gemmatales bacterium]|nr:MAG: hypothetical protein KatS3mg105_2311 [Gemmatales bacterium]